MSSSTQMQPFVDWLEESGFYVRGFYDPVTGEQKPVGKIKPFPWQYDIFKHVFTPGPDGQLPYRTVIYSAPKKSGKTIWAAAITAWWAEQIPNTEIFCLASDHEQAQDRVFEDVAFHYKQTGTARVLKSKIELPNGTVIKAVSSDYRSAAGSRHSLTVWDELWCFTNQRYRRLWAEMTPINIPGVPVSLRLVVTYAGFIGESELLEELYHTVVRDKHGNIVGEVVPELAHIRDNRGEPVCFRRGKIFAYWDHVPRMPWHTDEYLAEQMATLSPSEYARFFRNEWVGSKEEFIPIEWWDRAATKLEKPPITDPDSPFRNMPIIIGVDIGWKHDTSALAAVYYDHERDRVGLFHHRIWQSDENALVDIESLVELEIQTLCSKYNVVRVLCDPTQFYGAITRLRAHGLPVEEFTQSQGNMIKASSNLYNLLRSSTFEAYPDDEIREHIRHARAENKGKGIRIVKSEGKPNDFAIALAMAALGAVESKGVRVSEPIRIRFVPADKPRRARTHLEEMDQSWLPPALRT